MGSWKFKEKKKEWWLDCLIIIFPAKMSVLRNPLFPDRPSRNRAPTYRPGMITESPFWRFRLSTVYAWNAAPGPRLVGPSPLPSHLAAKAQKWAPHKTERPAFCSWNFPSFLVLAIRFFSGHCQSCIYIYMSISLLAASKVAIIEELGSRIESLQQRRTPFKCIPQRICGW